MTIPSSSLYPTAIDNDSSLFADPVNSLTFTLKTDVSDVGTELELVEDISAFETPCFFAFVGGDIVYVISKNNTTRILTVERGPVSSTHTAGETLRPTVAAEYFNQLKRAILAVENTLGINPQGTHQNVVDRLNNVDLSISNANAAVALSNQTLTETDQELDATQASLTATNATLSSVQNTQQTMNGEIDTINDIVNAGNNVVPVGAIMPWPGVSAPPGFLICDGALISRATYAGLFTAIGTTFGTGNGTTTFGIPDMRSRTPIGAGQGAGLTNRVLGGVLGEETHLLTEAEMPSHEHPIEGNYANSLYATGSANNVPATLTTITTGSAGQDTPHNNMQPSIVLNFIIKY